MTLHSVPLLVILGEIRMQNMPISVMGLSSIWTV